MFQQQSVKAYVDAQITAEDLDFHGDSGTGAVDLDPTNQTLQVVLTLQHLQVDKHLL